MLRAALQLIILIHAIGIGTLRLSAQVDVPREVIALTSTKQANRSGGRTDHVHDLLEMPLNFHGIVVRSRNLSEGEPPPFDPRVTRAVVTWFQGPEELPTWLFAYLDRARDAGLRIVHLGSLGPLHRNPKRLARWLQRLGLESRDGYLDDPFHVAVDLGDKARTCSEAEPLRSRPCAGPASIDAKHDRWIQVWDRRKPKDVRTPVVTGEFGGIALQPWMLREGSGVGDRRWQLDPFAFTAAAFGTKGLPAPDPYVALGRRRFLLHVDGDGFNSPTTVRPGDNCGKVFLDEIVDRYRIPMTVSIIVASLTQRFDVEKPTPDMLVARQIFARDWVEVASHAVLHPLNWRGHISRRRPAKFTLAFDKLAGYEHSMIAEVRDSVRFINERLTHPDKPCRVMLWSGTANPREPVLEQVAKSGCVNLNGGVYRWDATTNSVGYVSSWGKELGREYQVYCGIPNENVYRGFFTTMPNAFGHVDQTLENTARHRILKPANLYVHFYSAERPGRLAELHRLIQRWFAKEETIPCVATELSRAVHSAWAHCRIQALPGERGFVFVDFRHCRTARIDAANRHIDWSKSEGILGARRMKGVLYVHLAAANAKLIWAAKPSPAPHLEQAGIALTDCVADARGLRFRCRSGYDGTVVLAGFPPGSTVSITVGGVKSKQKVTPEGRVVLQCTAGNQVWEVRS